LAEDEFGVLFHKASADSGKADDAPEVEEEEDEEPEHYVPRNTKRPRGPSAEAGGSSKKAKASSGGFQRQFDSRRAELDRIKMLSTTSKGTKPVLPGAK
jgi:hypothetical protein